VPHHAPWPDAPRYAPFCPLPQHVFLPGGGGEAEELPLGRVLRLREDNWFLNLHYLYGIDLYHQGFFWESHEAWELLWRLEKRKSALGWFLQGLIKNSAAQIKLLHERPSGAAALSQQADEHFRQTAPDEGLYMGLDLLDLAQQMRRHYEPLWQQASEQAQGLAPRLRLPL
jgi:hypothetical protein